MINDIAFASAVAINAGAGIVLAIQLRGTDTPDTPTLPEAREYATGQVQRRNDPQHPLAIARPNGYRGRHRAPTETDHMRNEAAI